MYSTSPVDLLTCNIELYNANFTDLQVDRIYLGSPNVIAVLDHEKKRTFLIKKKGLPDVGMMLS